MSAVWIVLITLGVIIIVVLSVIAIRLQRQVKRVENKKQQQKNELQTLKDNHQQYLHNSIQVLAQGLLDEQLTLTEGAIRISVLLDNLPDKEQHRETFSAFYQLTEATSHIPILNAWKKLPKKDKHRYDKEREQLEETYKEFVLDAAQRIRTKNLVESR